MESNSIEARAFKSSCFVSEAPVNANPQEDHFFLSSAAAADDFSVDQFFEFHGLSEEEEEEDEEEDKTSSSLHDRINEGSSFSVDFSYIDFSDSFSVADGLAIPAEDMEELELWSHLMDGTLHHDNFACPATYPDVIPAPNRVHFEPKSKPVLTRPRSKRPRSIPGSWATFSLIEADRVRVTGLGLARNRKIGMKRKSPVEDGDSAKWPAQQRKCTHCQVQKTPQWRTGPLGPKTLCNACGVRFNMGRLFPEYRPACSPTFSSEVHSNNHRKVSEIRKRKMTGSGLASKYSELLKEKQKE